VLSWTLGDRQPISIEFELRPNAIWRFGRVFFTCPRCSRRAARIYVPARGFASACRRCWGLTYESRQGRSYKPRGSLLGFLTYAMSAQVLTLTAREQRAEAAARRYAERRGLLKKQAANFAGPLLRHCPYHNRARPPAGGRQGQRDQSGV
jgi:hypothetical protein